MHLCYLFTYLLILKADTSVNVPSYEQMSQTYSSGIVLTPTHSVEPARAAITPQPSKLLREMSFACWQFLGAARITHVSTYVHTFQRRQLCVNCCWQKVVWFNMLFDVSSLHVVNRLNQRANPFQITIARVPAATTSTSSVLGRFRLPVLSGFFRLFFRSCVRFRGHLESL